MTSIYEQAMGADFQRLHPQIRQRFGFCSEDSVAAIGRGVMEEVWRGPAYTLPFLYLGTWRRIMFPERGRDVPFEIRNYAYKDRFGRETVTWNRTFHTTKTRRFDATMVYSDRRGRIIDYLGSHQHLAVEIDLGVDANGGMHLRSGSQRFYEGLLGFRFPMLFSGYADVHEWYDDALGRFRISVEVRNRAWGRLFGYHGTFDVEWLDVEPGGVPEDQFPVREERRD